MHKDFQENESLSLLECFAVRVRDPLWKYEAVVEYYIEFLDIVDGLMLMSSLSSLKESGKISKGMKYATIKLTHIACNISSLI